MDHSITAHFHVQGTALPSNGGPAESPEATIIKEMAAAMFGGHPTLPDGITQATILYRGIRAMIDTSRATGVNL